MNKTCLALLFTLLISAAASAQDGGKLDWRGKGKDEPKAAMDEAKRHGQAMMLFFTSEG